MGYDGAELRVLSGFLVCKVVSDFEVVSDFDVVSDFANLFLFHILKGIW